jgi:hypothetical protein
MDIPCSGTAPGLPVHAVHTEQMVQASADAPYLDDPLAFLDEVPFPFYPPASQMPGVVLDAEHLSLPDIYQVHYPEQVYQQSKPSRPAVDMRLAGFDRQLLAMMMNPCAQTQPVHDMSGPSNCKPPASMQMPRGTIGTLDDSSSAIEQIGSHCVPSHPTLPDNFPTSPVVDETAAVRQRNCEWTPSRLPPLHPSSSIQPWIVDPSARELAAGHAQIAKLMMLEDEVTTSQMPQVWSPLTPTTKTVPLDMNFPTSGGDMHSLSARESYPSAAYTSHFKPSNTPPKVAGRSCDGKKAKKGTKVSAAKRTTIVKKVSKPRVSRPPKMSKAASTPITVSSVVFTSLVGNSSGPRSEAVDEIVDKVELKAKPRKPKTYNDKIPSSHCHLCARASGFVKQIACVNVSKGNCRKVVCDRCFKEHGWDWEAAIAPRSEWQCTHCRGVCTPRAQCEIYKKTNAKRKKDAMTKKLCTGIAAASASTVHPSLPLVPSPEAPTSLMMPQMNLCADETFPSGHQHDLIAEFFSSSSLVLASEQRERSSLPRHTLQPW